MKILLVSATYAEIQPLMETLSLRIGSNRFRSHDVFVLITGVGMVATAYILGRTLSTNQFDLAINAGIAGSFDTEISLGQVVSVGEDCFSELGAEDDEHFLTIDSLGFGESRIVPVDFDRTVEHFKTVKAITVNKVHGNAGTIEKTISQWSPDIESMEGAAFFYSCNDVNLPSIQLRGISNYVEKRNREGWNIRLAVKNLNEALINLISVL